VPPTCTEHSFKCVLENEAEQSASRAYERWHRPDRTADSQDRTGQDRTTDTKCDTRGTLAGNAYELRVCRCNDSSRRSRPPPPPRALPCFQYVRTITHTFGTTDAGTTLPESIKAEISDTAAAACVQHASHTSQLVRGPMCVARCVIMKSPLQMSQGMLYADLTKRICIRRSMSSGWGAQWLRTIQHKHMTRTPRCGHPADHQAETLVIPRVRFAGLKGSQCGDSCSLHKSSELNATCRCVHVCVAQHALRPRCPFSPTLP
jgi:hypothetical protein